MMQWLLKYEGYLSGVVVAVLLHALLIYIVMPSKFNPQNMVRIEQPAYISATVTKDNPQRTRQLQELERQRQQQAREQQRARDVAKAAEEQKKREQAALAEANKKEAQRKLEAEAQAQKQRDQVAATEKERQAAEAKAAEEKGQAALRETERQRQVAQEQAAREVAEREAANRASEQAQALSAENQLVAQYTTIIREIVESNWSQPPSARNGMQTLINIRLSPVGDILSSVVVQSSGDAIFDRSALQAVNKAGSFPELRELQKHSGVFERNFRDFNLLFSPEDLLR